MFTSPFFTPYHHNPAAEFGSLFRLLDSAVADLAPSASNQGSRATARHHSFTPRFDVREVGSNYELQGELPGIQQQDLQIEFVDERTLVIKGNSQRETTKTNFEEHQDAVANGEAETPKTVEGTEANVTSDAASDKSVSTYHKPSVEDEDYVDAGAEATEKPTAEQASNTDSNTVSNEKAEAAPAAVTKPAEPSFKYWVSERSVGQFERRFAFPGRVDQEAVTASLKNGILSVVVPKIVERQARKIEVQ